MANVKNRRIVVEGMTYRWSSIGGDGGIGITVGVEADDEGRVKGQRVGCVVSHDVLVLPSLVRRIVLEARADGWDPLSRAGVRAAGEYRVVLEGPFVDEAPRRPPRLPEEPPPAETALLDAIRAAPDDDAPRLVYADWLLERGDQRGEYIVLACARSPLTPTESARMESLLTEHEIAWLGPVANVTRARRWERGFLAEAQLDRRARGVVEPAFGHLSWRTVRRINARGSFLAPSDIARLLSGAGLGPLDHLEIQADALVALALDHRPPSSVGLDIFLSGPVPPRLFDALVAVAAVPHLRHLRVAFDLRIDEALVLARPGLALTVASREPPVEEWAFALDAARAPFDEVRVADGPRFRFESSGEVVLRPDRAGRWSIRET